MIRLILIGNDYKYELENIIQLFYPQQSISADQGDFASITAKRIDDVLSVHVKIERDTYYKDDRCYDKNDYERMFCAMLFEILSQITGIIPKWGIQTGVRPVKLLRSLAVSKSMEYAEDYFKNKLLVSDEKYNLAHKTMNVQSRLIDKIKPNSFSLYISIPFCLSRCSYCSFISHDVSKSAKLIPEYVDLLCKEIEYTAQIANRNGMKLQTVYFGGGTPTAIEAEQLGQIMRAVEKHFDMTDLLEYTVEAGRPDTITEEKLNVIRSFGNMRISINPQTLNDKVLCEIRRNHTSQQFYDAFNMARKLGFDNINTDLIAGLPTDTPESFNSTLDDIIRLSPECVTVHTLSIKRSSRLVYKNEADYDASGKTVSDMLEYSHSQLDKTGYLPYYMYRQSRMAGNNENIGWSKSGYESLYNVFIMEEAQHIFALGAGASSKLVFDGGRNIERIFNYKYPYEYISGFDEIIRRKDKLERIIVHNA